MLLAIVHLTLAAIWMGAMAYSLVVVQPRVARFFADDARREELLVALAHGNRWPVVALLVAILASAAGAFLTWHRAATGYVIALLFDGTAGLLFVYVSWRHWPARIFAVPAELPSFRRRLRRIAWTMLVLVGTAFLAALTESVAEGAAR